MTLHRREISITATGGTPATEDWSLSGANDGSGVTWDFPRPPLNIWRAIVDDAGVTAASPTFGILDETSFDFSAGAPGTEDHYTTDVQEFRGRLANGPLELVGDDLAEGDVVRFVVFWER